MNYFEIEIKKTLKALVEERITELEAFIYIKSMVREHLLQEQAPNAFERGRQIGYKEGRKARSKSFYLPNP